MSGIGPSQKLPRLTCGSAPDRCDIGQRINVAMRSVEELPSERHIGSLVPQDSGGALAALPELARVRATTLLLESLHPTPPSCRCRHPYFRVVACPPNYCDYRERIRNRNKAARQRIDPSRHARRRSDRQFGPKPDRQIGLPPARSRGAAQAPAKRT